MTVKKTKSPLLFLFSILTLWCFAGLAQSDGEQISNVAKEGTKAMQKDTKVRIKTNLGEMTILLDAQKAPDTVANFLQYARKGFYDGTIFHRVIKGFMIQGGGFEPGMKQKATDGTIRNEADNGLANDKGTIAMARTSDPHSATAQFFINANNNDFLNYRAATPDGWGYCVFGKLVAGESVLDAIGNVSTGSSHGHDDVPVDDVILEKVTIDE
uniref:Peptidyl-prolyl cis-trans isomerase n=1 Tax=Candidatus Kentrum sp. DK TaxID=2126562 RepID=A0A450TF90_9GAMM|nr:MAG: peptidyl-prolyl cis-trans isomerase B (cyclophilin B) [Candidatus Kentron sp. DK]